MNSRLTHLLLVIVGGFSLLGARLFQVMVLDAELHAESSRRILAHSLPAVRGPIYTADGLVLAEDRPGWDLVIRFDHWVPRANDNLLILAQQHALKLSPQTLQDAMNAAHTSLLKDVDRERRLNGRDTLSSFQLRLLEQRPYDFLDDQPEEIWQTVAARPEDFPGLEPRLRSRRTYPQGILASHVVGYVSGFSAEDRLRRDDSGNPRHLYLLDMLKHRSWLEIATDPELQRRTFFPRDTLGRTGLERFYEEDLRGLRGVRVITKEIVSGRRVDRQLQQVAATTGWPIHTTLDSRWQRICEAALQRHCGPRGGGIVILEADTGAVKTMASWPAPVAGSVRAADLEDTTGNPLLNKCIQDQYPLASVFKLVTAIAALEEGIAQPGTRFNCTAEGFKARGTPRQRCWIANQFHTGHGPLNLEESLAVSCNIWFFESGIRLGHPRLSIWARRFGFGEQTGIDLPGEVTGQLPPRKRPEITNFAIGSGNFSGSILQAAHLAALIATAGRPIRPHLVDTSRPTLPPRLPVSERSWQVVRQGMHDAVHSGTARQPVLQRLGVHGKTGTAQLGHGRQSHLWFVGDVSLRSRRYAFAICLLEGGSGEAKAPAVMAEILESLEKSPL